MYHDFSSHDFSNTSVGSLKKCGGLPIYLSKPWLQLGGTDLACLFQFYYDHNKLKIPHSPCISRSQTAMPLLILQSIFQAGLPMRGLCNRCRL